MKEGRTYFVINDGQMIDERIIAFTRQGEVDYIIFVNRTDETVKINNISQILDRFKDFEEFNGEFVDDCVTVNPYGYAIIKATFVH